MNNRMRASSINIPELPSSKPVKGGDDDEKGDIWMACRGVTLAGYEFRSRLFSRAQRCPLRTGIPRTPLVRDEPARLLASASRPAPARSWLPELVLLASGGPVRSLRRSTGPAMVSIRKVKSLSTTCRVEDQNNTR